MKGLKISTTVLLCALVAGIAAFTAIALMSGDASPVW
jgi:hypothetical protein